MTHYLWIAPLVALALAQLAALATSTYLSRELTGCVRATIRQRQLTMRTP